MRKILALVFLSVWTLCACSPNQNLGPAPTPAPTVDPDRLRLLNVPEQIAFQGENFQPIDLQGFLRYRNHRTLKEIVTWSATGSEHLVPSMTAGLLSVESSDPNWYGSESVHISAYDPASGCLEQDIKYTRLNESAAGHVRVIFVANSGFLIEAGGEKVMIDAPMTGYEAGALMPSYEWDLLANAEPPFDDIDLILISHNHADHFDAEGVREYMRKSPLTVLVSTSQVVEQLSEFGNRVIAVNPIAGEPASMQVDGIGVEALYLSHPTAPSVKEEVFNNGYIVTMSDVTFFHSGDISELADVFAYDLSSRGIDLAFIPYPYIQTTTDARNIEQNIGATHVFPSHYQFEVDVPNYYDEEAILNVYPGAIFFHSELESWIMP